MKNKNPLRGASALLSEHYTYPVAFNKNLLIIFAFFFFMAGCKKADYKEEHIFNPPTFAQPAVINTSPSLSDTGVVVNGDIAVVFNQAMDFSTITETTFTVYDGANVVPGTVSFSSNTTAIFSPASELDANTTYTVTITTGAHDLKGHAIVKNYVWEFTTKGSDHYEMTQRTTAVTDFVRDGSKLMQMGGYMYSYGGWTPADSYNDVYRSNGNLSTWKKMPNAPWHGRHTFGLNKIGSTLYVFGGDYLHTGFDVWSSTDGENFSKVSDDLHSTIGSRLLYGACSHNNKLFVMGGQANLALNTGLSDVWSSSDGVAWTQIATDKEFLAQNISGSVISFNGKIWVLGGGYYDHPDASTRWTNHVYNSPDGIDWTQQPDAPWVGRQYTDVCVWDNKLWLVGGNNGPNLADIWYMEKNGTWVQFQAPDNFIGRHATAVSVFNNKLVITCGNYHNDCWVIEKKPGTLVQSHVPKI